MSGGRGVERGWAHHHGRTLRPLCWHARMGMLARPATATRPDAHHAFVSATPQYAPPPFPLPGRTSSRSTTARSTTVNNTTVVVAPPVVSPFGFGMPFFGGYGGYGFGVMPFPFFGGLIQIMFLLLIVNVVFSVVKVRWRQDRGLGPARTA